MFFLYNEKKQINVNAQEKITKEVQVLTIAFFFVMPDHSVVQKYMPGGFISNTLLGIPFMGEITQAQAVGFDNTAVGRVTLGIGRKSIGVRLLVHVGKIEATNNIYYKQ